MGIGQARFSATGKYPCPIPGTPMKSSVSLALTLCLLSCGTPPLHVECTRENAVDAALNATFSEAWKSGVLPMRWQAHDWRAPSYKAVEMDGEVFTLADTAVYISPHLDSTIALPFKVVMSCAKDGKMEVVERSIGQPIHAVDPVRLERHLKEIRFYDSLDRVHGTGE